MSMTGEEVMESGNCLKRELEAVIRRYSIECDITCFQVAGILEAIKWEEIERAIK